MNTSPLLSLLNEPEENRFPKPMPSAKIYRADVFEFLSTLEDESVDLIVTDPAYSGMNQHLQLGSGRIIGKYTDKASSGKWFEEFHDTLENYGNFLEECFRVLRNNRHIYIMFDSYSLLSLGPLVRQYFDVKNLITWDKVNIGMGHYFRRRHEFVVFASKGKRPLNHRNIPDVWRIKRLMPIRYPTQKPVEIFTAMLAASAEPGFMVCDPFLGGGSSAIAALRHGCDFIGCDLSQRAIDLAKERVKVFQERGVDVLQNKSLLVENESYGWLNGYGPLK